MEEETKKPTGLFGAVQRLGNTLMATLQTRLELLSIELAEERQRFLSTLAWTAATLFFTMLAVVVGTITVVMMCPASARSYVLAGFALLYVALAVGAGLVLRKRLRDRPTPFAATLGELKKDVQTIRPRSRV